jgi:thiol-disulfide isomerase/thioredoxin
MALLEKAIAAGYSDMQQMKDDSDLEAVRALPGFSEKLAAWEAKASEAAMATAKAELAAGESFPFTFALTDVSGAPISLESLKGKVCIVDVWGTWCPPCRAEIPSFIKLQEKFGAQGFQMVGLNEEQSSTPEGKTKLVTDYIAGNGINYPCALITEEVMGQIPEFQGFPTTLFIDKTGKVRLKAVGLHEYAYLESVVSVLLAEETPAAAAPAEPAPAEPAPTEPAPAPAAEEPAAPTPAPADAPAESTPAPAAEATEPKP